MPAKLPRHPNFEMPEAEERGQIVFRVPSNHHGPGGYYTCPASGHPYMRYADLAWYIEQGDWVIMPVKGSTGGWAVPETKLLDVDKAEILLQAQELGSSAPTVIIPKPRPRPLK